MISASQGEGLPVRGTPAYEEMVIAAAQLCEQGRVDLAYRAGTAVIHAIAVRDGDGNPVMGGARVLLDPAITPPITPKEATIAAALAFYAENARKDQ